MIAHLASLAEKRVILRAYLHAEADVERALGKVGWKISNSPREDSLPPSSTFPGSSKLFPCRSFLFIC
ncbi:unnamed protein product [Brassica oleracea var. botrytis]|uniref:Uncharacterized protein n=1 Tax=Brassica oleracea TaxID=3712 RepID=A0A3P6EKI8_BRAOL|nr:unnamed protein product [Brassica oleracea]